VVGWGGLGWAGVGWDGMGWGGVTFLRQFAMTENQAPCERALAEHSSTLQLHVARASQVSVREMGAQAQSKDLYCGHVGTTAE